MWTEREGVMVQVGGWDPASLGRGQVRGRAHEGAGAGALGWPGPGLERTEEGGGLGLE